LLRKAAKLRPTRSVLSEEMTEHEEMVRLEHPGRQRSLTEV
jgi:hypothetical protein